VAVNSLQRIQGDYHSSSMVLLKCTDVKSLLQQSTKDNRTSMICVLAAHYLR